MTGESEDHAPSEELSLETLKQKCEELREQLETAQLKAEESFNRAARASADAENARRIAEQDVQKAHKFALESFVKALLPVLDTLEKALEFNPETTATESVKAMREGVALTLKMFLDTFTRFGVEQINPLDQPFNAEHHEALAVTPAPDKIPNSVIQVIQKGYLLNGRIARRARVITAAQKA